MSAAEPGASLVEALRAAPCDWSRWRVYGDWLHEQGDPRAELIALEHRLATEPQPPADQHARIDALTATWGESWSEALPDPERCRLEWWVEVTGAASLFPEVTGAALGQLLAPPSGWLLSFLTDPADPAPSVLHRHCDRAIATIVARIEAAFDGVPPPDEHHLTLYQAQAADDYAVCDRSRDHLGRWQDLPDSQILDNQWALPYLDEQGVHYYLPALMCFELRRFLDGYTGQIPVERIIESLEYLVSPGMSDRAYMQQRFRLLDRRQRAAVCAFTLASERRAAFRAWAAVGEEDQGWFDRLWPPD